MPDDIAVIEIVVPDDQTPSIVEVMIPGIQGPAGPPGPQSVPFAREIAAGDGLQGGGDLSEDRTLSVDGTVVRTTDIGTAAVQDDTRYAHRANNLSDLADAATARTNLDLGTAAQADTGTGATQVPTNADLPPSTNVTLSAIRVYDVSGSPHTWTKPADLAYVIVEVWGGGGGGAGGYGVVGVGSGGGGGGYGKKLIDAGDLGATETATVGAEGTPGTAGNSGNAGGTSSFGAHLSCTGGNGGATSGAGVGGGDGGAPTGADDGISGGRGHRSSGTTGVLAGGGGDAPRGGAGEIGVHAESNAGTGNPGKTPGGGGAGGRTSSSSGSAGGPGRIVVYEYVEV
jgi:hypothetical protein